MYRSILKEKIDPLIIRNILLISGISIKDTNILIDDISCSYRYLISSNYYDKLFDKLGFIKIFKNNQRSIIVLFSIFFCTIFWLFILQVFL